MQHTVDGAHGRLGDIGRHVHYGPFVAQGVVDFFEGHELHKVTFVATAGAVVGRHGYELLAGALLLHLVQDAAFRHHEESLHIGADGIFEQGGGGAHHVSQFHNRASALGVHQHLGIGILLLELDEFFHREAFMHVARTVPQEHVAPRNAVDVSPEVAVGSEDNFFVLRKTLHNLLGIARSYHHVRHCLRGGRGVDVGNDRVVGVVVHKFGELLCRTAFGERAGGVEVGNEHRLFGAENFVGFTHKVHAAHHNHVGVRLGGLAGECKAVTDKVGDVLNHAFGIIVCKDYGVLLPTHFADLGFEVYAFGHRFIDIAERLPSFFDCGHRDIQYYIYSRRINYFIL